MVVGASLLLYVQLSNHLLTEQHFGISEAVVSSFLLPNDFQQEGVLWQVVTTSVFALPSTGPLDHEVQVQLAGWEAAIHHSWMDQGWGMEMSCVPVYYLASFSYSQLALPGKMIMGDFRLPSK